MATTHGEQRRELLPQTEQASASTAVPQIPAPAFTAPTPGRALRTAQPADTSDPLGGTQADRSVVDTLARRRGSGRKLPSSVSDELGGAYGADLSQVRVHADSEADAISRSVQATAFTHGNDLYFRSGAYSPDSSSGKRLLAHELAHVAQQQTGRDTGGSGVTIGRADDPVEREADRMADGALAGLQRQAVRRSTAAAPSAALNRTIRRWGWGKKSTAAKEKVDDGGEVLGSLNEMLGAIEMVNQTSHNWSDTTSVSDGKHMSKGDLFGAGSHSAFDGNESGNYGMSSVGTGLDVVNLASTGTDLYDAAGDVHNTKSGELDHNQASQELEGKVWGMAGTALSASNNMANIAKTAGSHMPTDLLPGLDFASSITNASRDTKAAIEHSVAAHRLGGHQTQAKHELDHFLPENLRLQRLNAFLGEFEKSPSLKAAATDLKTKTTSASDKQQEYERAKRAYAQADAQAKALPQARQDVSDADERIREQSDAVTTQTGTHGTAKQRLQTAQEKDAEALAEFGQSPGSQHHEGAMAQLEHLAAKEKYEQGGTAKELKESTDAEAAAQQALERSKERLANRTTERDKAQTRVDDGTTAKGNLGTLRAAMRLARKERDDAKAELRASEATYKLARAAAYKDAGKDTKKEDLKRFAEVFSAYAATIPALVPTDASPLGLDDAAKKLFLKHLADQNIKEFGKGTNIRDAHEKTTAGDRSKDGLMGLLGLGKRSGGTRTKNADGTMSYGATPEEEAYGQMRELGKVGKFGQRRKAEMATLSSVGAVGNTLDAAGTFTGAGDGGATKATGKVIKGLKAGYEGVKKLVKRGRRVGKLAEARDAVEYGPRAEKRGLGWKTKMFFFGGNIEDHMDKTTESVNELQTGGVHASTAKFKEARGARLSDEKAHDVLRKLKLQADRRADDLIRGLKATNPTVRNRAKEIVHAIAESNLAGALAGIKESELDKFAQTPPPADLDKLEATVRKVFKKQLEGVGG